MSDVNIGSGRFDDLDIDLGYDGLSNDTAIGNVDFGTASISGSQDNYRSEYSGADAHIQRPTSLTEHAYRGKLWLVRAWSSMSASISFC